MPPNIDSFDGTDVEVALDNPPVCTKEPLCVTAMVMPVTEQQDFAYFD